MTRRIMMNLNKKLIEIGFEFEEYNYRLTHKHEGGNNDFISLGVLRNTDGTDLTHPRLEEVLSVAKTKNTYLIVRPGVKEVKGRLGRLIPVKDHELAVCFAQRGVFTTLLDAYPHVDACLKRNFLYYQEDEALLELKSILKRLSIHVKAFDTAGYGDAIYLEPRSSQLRKYLNRYGAAVTHKGEIYGYMDDFIAEKHAKAMCCAGACLHLICE